MMKLLIASAIWPHPSHSIRAANIVIFELVLALKKCGWDIGFLKVSRAEDSLPEPDERKGIEALKLAGIEVLNPVVLPQNNVVKRKLVDKFLSPKVIDFYPELNGSSQVEKAVESYSPDILLVPWSEWLTAVCSKISVKKFTYYGNPDHKAALLRAKFDWQSGGDLSRYLRTYLGVMALKKVHLSVMKKYDWIGNVAHNDAELYRNEGLKQTFYLQNLWPNRFGDDVLNRRLVEPTNRKIRIIGNVGKLFGTANRYGLKYIQDELMYELRTSMSGHDFSVDILGAGNPPKELIKLFEHPDVLRTGFVDDIDQYMLESNAFLCVNNATPYKVCHTRYLHAWSMANGVVAHVDSKLSMPEMENDVNCLLGSDAHEIAEMVKLVSTDKKTRLRLGEAGYHTFKKHFQADSVAQRITDCVSKK